MKSDPIRDAFANPIPVAPIPEDGDPGAPDMRDLDPPAGDTPPPRALPDEDAPEAKGATLPLNDYGNGLRLLHYYGRDISFVPRLGWFRWDARRWVQDEDEIGVRTDAQKIAAHILHEIPFVALSERQRTALDLWLDTRADLAALARQKEKTAEETARLAELTAIEIAGKHAQEILRKERLEHRRHARTSGNNGKITALMAEAITGASMGVDALNRDPYMTCCENGVLHFTAQADPLSASFGDASPAWQVDLVEHDRAQRISKMLAAPYDPAAPAPEFERFLRRVQPDPEMRAFLQRWFGYCLTGRVTEHKLAFFFGQGRNGKSTLVDTIAHVMADYGTTLDIESLTGAEQRKGSEATPDLVRLPGARFVQSNEPEEGQKFKEALIKRMTGGDPINIRRLHKEAVEIRLCCKFTISGNNKPEIRGADDGIWRRMMLIPWSEKITDAEVDGDLPAKLKKEAPGILAWMVRGCLDYLNNGLGEPATVRAATIEYRTESDPMREFLTTECVVTGEETDFAARIDMLDAFNAWRIACADNTWTAKTVTKSVRDRAGLIKSEDGRTYDPDAKRNGVRGYRGVIISEDALDRMAEARQTPGFGR